MNNSIQMTSYFMSGSSNKMTSCNPTPHLKYNILSKDAFVLLEYNSVP